MVQLLQTPPLYRQEACLGDLTSFIKQHAIVSVTRLNSTDQSAALYLADHPKTQAKELAVAINVDRSVALEILKNFVKINIAMMTQLPAQNSAIQGAYIFTLASHMSKDDLLAAFKAQRIEDLEPINKDRLYRFLEDLLDETAKKAVLYLCDHPKSQAKQIIEDLELEILAKSLQDKLSALARKVGLLKREKPFSASNKAYQYSIVDEIPSTLLKEILLLEIDTDKVSSNLEYSGDSEENNTQGFLEDLQIDKTKQNLSAQEYLKKVEELKSNRNKIKILEKEICQEGKLATDYISPLWSNFSSDDWFDKQQEQSISVDDFLQKVRALKQYRKEVQSLEKEICAVGELARKHVSPLWSSIMNPQNN